MEFVRTHNILEGFFAVHTLSSISQCMPKSSV